MPSSNARKKRAIVEEKHLQSVEKPNGNARADGRDFSVIKFFNQIFSENKSHAHRLAAVEIMCNQISSLPLDDVHGQAQLWIGHLMKVIDASKLGNSNGLALCCHTLGQLLVLCSNSAELCRIISLNVVPKLLTSLMEITPTEQDAALIAAVNVMKICIKYFGGSCLSFKNKVEAYLMKISLRETENIDSLLLKTCLSTLSYLPYCGGQGSSGTKHSEMWYNQLVRLLHAADELTNYFHSPCGLSHTGAVIKPVSGQLFPTVSDDTSLSGLSKAAHYLLVYLKAMQAMLTTPFTWKVQLPVKHLLSVVCNLTRVTPDSVIFRKKTNQDLEIICKALPSLHIQGMNILSTLAEVCGSCLYPYSTTICELLSSQLQWTKTVLDSENNTSVLCRANVLDVIHSLISQPSFHSMLCAISSILLEHALFDLSLPSSTNQVEVVQIKPPIAKKSRKHRLPSPADAVSTASEIMKKLSALRLIRQLLQYMSGSFTSKEIKMIYDSIVSLALSVQSSSDASYAKDAGLRHALYECLLATVHSYNTEVGPLTHISSQLIRNGLLDTCPLVRSLCNQGLLICQLAVEPRAPPFVQHSTAYAPETPAKKDSEVKDGSVPLDETYEILASQTVVNESKDSDAVREVTEVEVEDEMFVGQADIPAEGLTTDESQAIESSNHSFSSQEERKEMETDEQLEQSIQESDEVVQDLPATAREDAVTTVAAVHTETPDVLHTTVEPSTEVDEECADEAVLDMMNSFVSEGPDE